MPQDNKSETIVIRVSSDLKNELQKMADIDNRKLSDFIRLELKKIAGKNKKKK